MFENEEIFEYLSNLSDIKGSNAQSVGWLSQSSFLKKILIFPLKYKFYFLFLFFLIIIKKKSYLNCYLSKSRKTLIFDHSGKSIRKNLGIKNPINKILVPRKYIIKSIFKLSKKENYILDYYTNNFDRYNLLFFVKTCFEIKFCYEKYNITHSIITDDITPQSMAMIYISNTYIKNACIELFNIPGAFFNRNFSYFEKVFFKYFDEIWFSTYDLVNFKNLNFQKRKNGFVFFKSYGKKLLEKNRKENVDLTNKSLDDILKAKKIFFVLSSNYIGNEFNLFFILRYTYEIYRSLLQLRKYLYLNSSKLYILTHPSNSFSQFIIKILGYKKFNFNSYSNLNNMKNNIVMIAGNTSCLVENLIKGGISIYCPSLDYYPACYGLDKSQYILKTGEFNKNEFVSDIFNRLEINTNKIIKM